MSLNTKSNQRQLRRGLFIPLSVFLFTCFNALTEENSVFERADALYSQEEHQLSVDLLTQQLDAPHSDIEKSELQWRLARGYLNLALDAEREGVDEQEILLLVEKGEQAGQNAITSDPINPLAYYWKAVNVGKASEIRGIFSSLLAIGVMRDLLRRAVELDPDHAPSYYVLGQLYERVPGVISYGNKDYAVSLGRKSVDLQEQEIRSNANQAMDYDFYTELSKHLLSRNWSPAMRKKKHQKKLRAYESEHHPLDRAFHFEGTQSIQEISDRQEAKSMLLWVVNELGSIEHLTRKQQEDLQEAEELLKAYKP